MGSLSAGYVRRADGPIDDGVLEFTRAPARERAGAELPVGK